MLKKLAQYSVKPVHWNQQMWKNFLFRLVSSLPSLVPRLACQLAVYMKNKVPITFPSVTWQCNCVRATAGLKM